MKELKMSDVHVVKNADVVECRMSPEQFHWLVRAIRFTALDDHELSLTVAERDVATELASTCDVVLVELQYGYEPQVEFKLPVPGRRFDELKEIPGRVCEYCASPAFHSWDMPLSGGNPYPEFTYTCHAPACRSLAEGDYQMQLRYAADDAPDTPCSECGGNFEDGYACPLGHVYRPGECPRITGVF